MKKYQITFGLLRISLGFIFLWAFIDKVFGLGFPAASKDAWLLGTSPTFGFLNFASKGPFEAFYKSIAGNIFVDWLFMIGLLLVGLSLMLGIGVKIAGYSGALMMFLMYTAVLPPKNNPLFDEHIIYLLVLLIFTFVRAGHWIGFGRQWSNTRLVRKYSFLE